MNFQLLKLHHRLILMVVTMIAVTIGFAASIGELKPMAEVEWVDTLGEGGTCLMALVWIFFTLISRPSGRVTNLLIIGLLFLHISLLLDLLDEYFRYPENHAWLTAYESIPAPIGMILLTIGLYHWHKEQLTVNDQLRTRERVFREHGLVDYITGLYSAEYMMHQLEQELELSKKQNNSFAVLLLDIDEFDAFIQKYGDVKGDKFLRDLSELMMFELRPTDLACRYAGDRFVIMLSDTDAAEAEKLGMALRLAIESRKFEPLEDSPHFQCKVSVCAIANHDCISVDNIFTKLNEKMEQVKLSKRNLKAA